MSARVIGGFVLLTLTLTGCQRDRGYDREAFYPYVPALPSSGPVLHTKPTWKNLIRPDLVPVNMRVCRTQESEYVRWDVLVTVQNQGGDRGLNVTDAPVDVYVDFDPERPYGYDASTGEPDSLKDRPELLRDIPEPEKRMSVPRGGAFGGAAFSLWYVDGGPGYPYRRVPTQFTVFLDQGRGGNPGVVDESDEGNNGVVVLIDRYDEISGRTGTYAIGCWYSQSGA